jgi:WD40 repeat protein
MRRHVRSFVIALLVAGGPAAAGSESGTDVRWLSCRSYTPKPLAVNADGRLAAVRTSCECIVYDLESAAARHRWNDGTNVVQFSRDGRLVVATRPNHVTLWDTTEFGERLRITGHPSDWRTKPASDPAGPVISDDAELIAIPNGRKSFDQARPSGMLIHGRDGKLLQLLPLPDDAMIRDAMFLRGDRLLLSWFNTDRRREGTTHHHELWNPLTGERIHVFPRGEVAIGTPGGRLVAVGRRWPTPWRLQGMRPTAMQLAIHDIDSGKQMGVIEDPGTLTDFAWNPQGTRLLAAVGDRVVEWDMEWGMTGGDFVVTFDVDDGRPHASVAYTPDRRRRYATIEEPNGVDDDAEYLLCGWDAATGERLPLGRVVAGYNSFEKVFLPPGDRFIDMQMPFAIRDVYTGKTLQTVPKCPVPVSNVAFPDDDRFFVDDLLTDGVTGNQRRWTHSRPAHFAQRVFRDGRTVLSVHPYGVFITDVASGEMTRRCGPQEHEQRDVAADPDGRRLVIATGIGDRGAESRLVVLDPSRPDEPHVLHRHATAVAVRPDARAFLAASHAGIDELDIDTGRLLRSLVAPPGRVLFIDWSRDGALILAGGVRGHDDVNEPIAPEDEGWAVVIDAATGRVIPLVGHAGPVNTGAFSPDGSRCATGSSDTTIRLWATASGKEIHCFRGHRGAIHRIAYSPRGDRLLAAAMDGAAIWPVAGVVDPAIQPAPLAKEFKIVETVDAVQGPAVTESRVLPAAWAASDSPPVAVRVDWPVVRVGDFRPPEDLKPWLSTAPTVATLPASTRPAAPGSFPRHALLGSSRDGLRRLLKSPPPGKASVIVVDGQDEILARVDHDLALGEAAAIAPAGDVFIIVREAARGPQPVTDGSYRATVHNAATGKPSRVFDGIAARFVNAAQIDPLGRTFLLNIDNDAFELRDFATGRHLARLAGPVRHTAAYSPDGRFIVTTDRGVTNCRGSAVRLRDPRSLAVIRTLDNHLGVRWCRFTPDGRRLLVGQAYENTVNLVTSWDVDRGVRLGSQCGPASGNGTFSADGRLYLAFQEWQDVCSLWDVERGRIVCVILASRLPPNAPVFGTDGHSVHLGSPDGPRLWPVGDE